MTYLTIKILKILVAALNRKNLLTGKENNEVTSTIDEMESRQNRANEKISNSLKNIGKIQKKWAKRAKKAEKLNSKIDKL